MTDPDVLQAQFDQVEKKLGSFVSFCPDGASGSQVSGALSGLRVGIKDIIDVEGLPTRNGSAVCADLGPVSKDAPVVAGLRAAGAQILGKTTTTEFAFTDPTNCRNPYDLQRSPGGSSSGSGASVAAGLVDLALGTQTAGSLCRPAAYCGVVGLKPTYGLLPTEGVTPLAPSFDTVGIIARSVNIVADAFTALTGKTIPDASRSIETGDLLLPTAQKATANTMAAFGEARAALSETTSPTREVRLGLEIGAIVDAHRTVMLAEALHAHGCILETRARHLLQPKFRAALETAQALSTAQVLDARAVLAEARAGFWEQVADLDIILSLPVPEGAPLLDGTTGFQDWLTPWTVFGGPLLTLPWGLDGLGRPRAVMLAGPIGRDPEVLAVAAHLERMAPKLPQPGIYRT